MIHKRLLVHTLLIDIWWYYQSTCWLAVVADWLLILIGWVVLVRSLYLDCVHILSLMTTSPTEYLPIVPEHDPNGSTCAKKQYSLPCPLQRYCLNSPPAHPLLQGSLALDGENRSRKQWFQPWSTVKLANIVSNGVKCLFLAWCVWES